MTPGRKVFDCARCGTRFATEPEDVDKLVTGWRFAGIPNWTAIHDCAPGCWGAGRLIGVVSEPMTTDEYAKELEQ